MANIAVTARKIVKSYGDSQVLDELDMTVVRGQIYGLLGASGCGKTTLLSAFVAAKEMDSGDIRVLGNAPGKGVVQKIGYMPQETALVEDFSVKGAVQHFGWIFGMTNKEIDERFEFLQKLLDLPPASKKIKNCSGGQQRRISMAVTLVHNPDLLILDEPTVGLDPVLRQDIWDYFLKLTETEGKTIIMTTHYIEEANHTHRIGLMRNGKLLAEGSPTEMVARFNCDNVEEVFVLLCQKQELEMEPAAKDGVQIVEMVDGTQEDGTDADLFSCEPGGSRDVQKRGCKITTRGHALALLSKNMTKMFTNPATVVFSYFLPVFKVCVFFWAFNDDPKGIQIGIVNLEIGAFENCTEYGNNMPMGGARGRLRQL